MMGSDVERRWYLDMDKDEMSGDDDGCRWKFTSESVDRIVG